MSRSIALLMFVLTLAGCSGEASNTITRTPVDQALFGPSAMRLYPVFTQVSDWTGDGKPDGIEAVIEIQDQFGDPTKASGRIVFELYGYRPYNPDPRGQRVVAPWEGRLDSIEDQRARWNRVNRAYIFQLAYEDIRPGQPYVLSAMFELTGGGRFFDKIILEAETPTTPSTPPAITAPSVKPGSVTTQSTKPVTSHMPPPRADQP